MTDERRTETTAEQPSWDECPCHTWKIAPDDWDVGGNRSCVECTACGVPGERDEDTGDVFWPAT